jgi:hypothetical protein
VKNDVNVPSNSKKNKKNFGKNFVDFLKVTDKKSRIRIRIRQLVVRIRESGSVPKCLGSTKLIKTVLVLPETLDDGANCSAQSLCLDVSIDVPGSDVLRVVQREPRHVVQVCNKKINVVIVMSWEKCSVA